MELKLKLHSMVQINAGDCNFSCKEPKTSHNPPTNLPRPSPEYAHRPEQPVASLHHLPRSLKGPPWLGPRPKPPSPATATIGKLFNMCFVTLVSKCADRTLTSASPSPTHHHDHPYPLPPIVYIT